ncbi:tetratricopeptide repeat protein [Paracraurococcus lichenis]|uniref:Tetratricopeptide repeat protein n=1 Tax=Paracraurococcus lichenis TaxID=3064888 RepID=A0ABT9DWL5_9PROT|nr:hypothetical protein [Paracraurococcus sp. LOR1-02]MDO9708292.1 hypothetical protein [Paracraurococcus sp. LOR1-02]
MTEPAAKGAELRWRDRIVPIAALPPAGCVEQVRLGLGSFTLSGWVPAQPDDPLLPQILVVRAGVVRAECRAERAAGGRHGFELRLPLEVVAAPMVFDFTVYALRADGAAVRLQAEGRAAAALGLKLASVHDFYRQIQTPSTRTSDPEILLYASVYAFERFAGDYPLNAGALCVLGYRLLDAPGQEPELMALFDVQKERLLGLTPTLPEGLFLRWHTSIRLVAGYLAYQRGRIAEAIGHFEAIAHFAGDLPKWPTAMTNVLLGGFIAGYLHWEQGDAARAIACWSQAPDILRLGAGQAPLQNFYAYGEIANAIRVAQESFVARRMAEAGGPIADAAIGPPGRRIELENLPSPIGRLVRQRAAIRSAA